MEPPPGRERKTTWKEFLTQHWDRSWPQISSRSKPGHNTAYGGLSLLFLTELSTRKVEIAGIASTPNGFWMNQVGHNLTGLLNGKRYLIHDRDPLFTAEFLSILAEAAMASVKLPPRSPNLNAHADGL